MSKKTNTQTVEQTEIVETNPILLIPSQTPTTQTTGEYPLDGSQGNKVIIDCGSVSAAIRMLDSKGYKKGDIAKILNKRFQHVRNVLITPLKKGG